MSDLTQEVWVPGVGFVEVPVVTGGRALYESLVSAPAVFDSLDSEVSLVSAPAVFDSLDSKVPLGLEPPVVGGGRALYESLVSAPDVYDSLDFSALNDAGARAGDLLVTAASGPGLLGLPAWFDGEKMKAVEGLTKWAILGGVVLLAVLLVGKL